MYDNLDNAKQKLQGTYCYYDGRAVYVKDVQQSAAEGDPPSKSQPGKFKLYICYMDGAPRFFWRDLDDGKFQYMQFNIGYINHAGYALWYYRVPYKQWKQGLTPQQVGIRDKSSLTSHPHNYQSFGANDSTAAMMENRYPSFEVAAEMLNDPKILKVAFHQHFAMFKDSFRKDLVLEHKGLPVAFEHSHKTFKCTDHLAYLKESIAEMQIKVA